MSGLKEARRGLKLTPDRFFWILEQFRASLRPDKMCTARPSVIAERSLSGLKEARIGPKLVPDRLFSILVQSLASLRPDKVCTVASFAIA